MNVNLEPARQAFIAESRELLATLEKALLALESAPEEKEYLTAAFRSAHTIKGSAGVFGFDRVVELAHAMESVLERVRDGKLQVDRKLIELLLSCCDHVAVLVACSADAGRQADETTLVVGRDLAAQLQARLGAGTPAAQAQSFAAPEPREADVEAVGGGAVASDTWHISLRFGRGVLRDGMDPMSFLRYLGTLGEITSMTTLPDAMPAAGEMDPESCYLGMEIEFRSEADKETISGVFDFVREDCAINILPPHSRILDYVQLIGKLPEGRKRLGEILVSSGALTQGELDKGLALQEEQAKGRSAGKADAIGKILVEQGVVQPELVDAALEKQRHAKELATQEAKFVRVPADKLDQLINLVGELVIAGASTNLLALALRNEALQEASSNMVRLVELIRDGALQLRMVQIGETFNRFPRVVRDVGHELGKDIGLVISGAETELDKSMVERISDPLMHLVRNAIDHGIEPAAAREARGKSPRGKLFLNAYHDSGSIVIEVGDDGGGLDRDRILKKAIERGLASAGQALTDADIHKLIMEPGFSTAEQLSNLSGRGVGMDVVKRNIEALRGTIEIDSVAGQGTTIRMRLPLTLAIIDGFQVRVGEASYVVPLDTVVECLELGDRELQASESRNYVNLRGEVLPFVRLRELFELEAGQTRRENIVVVQYGGQRAGIVVDKLLGEIQTVIKPLSKIFAQLKGIGGSTILGSGEVALILDVPSLIQAAASEEAVKASVEVETGA